MYKKNRVPKSTIKANFTYEGETIEQKMRRVTENKEPIGGEGIEMIYTERKDGVAAEHNIRTDRWDIAVEAKDHLAKSYTAKREDRIKEREEKGLGKDAAEGMKKEGETPKPGDN